MPLLSSLQASSAARRTVCAFCGHGELKAKLDFEVAGVSAGAKAAVEKAGGSVSGRAQGEEGRSRVRV